MKLFRKQGANSSIDQTKSSHVSTETPNDLSSSTGSATVKSSTSWKRKTIIICVILGAVMLLITLAYAVYASKHKKVEIKAVGVCNSKSAGNVLQQASENLGNDKVKELQPIVEKIKSLKDYDKDPNCLYVTAKYSLNKGDAKAAKEDINKLEKVYKTDTGLDKRLVTEGAEVNASTGKTQSATTNASSQSRLSTERIEQLKKEQTFLEEFAADAKANVKRYNTSGNK